jgi:hypothetical protein
MLWVGHTSFEFMKKYFKKMCNPTAIFKLEIRSEIHVFYTYVSTQKISFLISGHKMIHLCDKFYEVLKISKLKTTFSLLIRTDPTFSNIKTNLILCPLKQETEISSFKFQENYTSS